MIQERLSYENIEMTLGIYSHLYPNEDVDVIERLNQII
ncbi:hypothetical protein RV12_GL001065 [Enterococcus quebecensis]|nr:hypothetical protein RV12_GL001065 [Enterococcus quebecensis]